MRDPLLTDLNTIENEDALLLLMDKVMDALGVDSFLFSYALHGWLPSGEPGEIQQWLSKGIDKTLLKGWLASFDVSIGTMSEVNRLFDPIRRYMVHQTMPHQFLLEELIKKNNKQYTLVQKRWFSTLIKHEMLNVISIPVQLPPSEYWSLSFYSNNTSFRLSSNKRAQLMFFAHNLVHHCIDVLHWREEGTMSSEVKLRAREKDCLYWSALGKTAKDTADILGLKTETVRKYLKNAMARLNARNKTQAVVKAIELGLLDLGVNSRNGMSMLGR